MPSQFRDLDEFLVAPPIELPIRGKIYRFPGSISATAGLLLVRLTAAAQEAARAGRDGAKTATEVYETELLDDGGQQDLWQEVMGGVDEEMARDGLTTAHTSHVFRTLIAWHLSGEEAALIAWERLGNVQTPNRATRRQASKGSGKSTQSRASTAGTTSPRKRPAKASPGPSSSPAGR